MRILIAEDNPDHREMSNNQLLEYVCQEAAGGHERLCILRSSRCDLVMCDYRMLEMNGFQFIHISTDDISTIPIIFATTHSGPRLYSPPVRSSLLIQF